MPSAEPACYRVGDLLVDPGRRRVERDGHEIALTGLTFDLLLVLAREAPNLASNDLLMQQVWPGRVVSPETVSQRIKLLRAALDDDPNSPRYLSGVRGHGYRLLVPVERCTIHPAVSAGPAAGPEAPPALASASIAPAPAAPPRRGTSGRWLFALGLIMAVSIWLIWLVWPEIQKPPFSSGTNGVTDATSPSIAVLPFKNRSRLADDALFVDGLHDDILTQISKVSALKVISRTSVERFRDTKLPLGDIARQLGVTTILECAVQRAGGRVRINVQLIDAATDHHLWAENYDRELTAANIFAIQSEVAAAIAVALQVTLTPAEQARVDSLPTRNLEAWTAYHVGRKQMSRRTSESLATAAQSFEHAIELDPTFALPYAGLADTLFLQTFNRSDSTASVERAEEILSEALRLDPDLPETLTTAAKFAELHGDYAAAEAGYRRAISLNPNHSTAYHWYGILLAGLGKAEEALRILQKGVELDPLSPVLRLVYGDMLGTAGRYDEAQVQLDEVRVMDPTNPGPYLAIGTKLAWTDGRLDEALPWLEKAAELDPGIPGRAARVAALFLDLEDFESARRWLARATTPESDSALTNEVAAILELYGGKSGEAAAFARRALERQLFKASWDGWPLRLLRDADLRDGRPDEARARYAAANPELLGGDAPRVIDLNHLIATDLAFVLQLTEEHETAVRLLEGSEAVLRRNRRLGEVVYGVADARIFALRGEKRLALEALREAVESHWRGPYWRYYRDFDPILASIRNEPEFKAVFADIERDMAAQRARLAERPEDAPLE